MGRYVRKYRRYANFSSENKFLANLNDCIVRSSLRKRLCVG